MKKSNTSKDRLRIGDEVLTKEEFMRMFLSGRQQYIQLHGFVRSKLSNGAFVIAPIKGLRWIQRRVFTAQELIKIST